MVDVQGLQMEVELLDEGCQLAIRSRGKASSQHRSPGEELSKKNAATNSRHKQPQLAARKRLGKEEQGQPKPSPAMD
jgi:FtsZ-binding cell division protein ZapB